MSEPKPTPSLIQQRFALRRDRNYAVWTIVSSIIAAALQVTLVIEGRGGWLLWFGVAAVVVFIGGAVFGAVKLVASRRATRDFENRYGRDAGIQN
ncbi:hypothetical protein [Microbacterium hydrocarbonoxydans]|uniref:hypothetical protein n=1 Tax=Microbacterium hydrocarbonoxydans TaxID=273678 RepID=UPI00204153E1|nr:hypothetical protein [Microbacterium hydrocarbonoxydans]MCM3778404.1 hypothetical protein [Microbacterium hydrocarbonoxydans]